MTATSAIEREILQVDSDVLGSVHVPSDETFHFPAGVIGFPEARRFVLIPTQRDTVYWLQSVEHTALTFVLVDPFEWVDEYRVDLSDEELEPLAPSDPADIVVLAIVTLPRSAEDPTTANLQGPLVFNIRRRTGRQIVVPDSQFGVRTPVDLKGVHTDG